MEGPIYPTLVSPLPMQLVNLHVSRHLDMHLLDEVEDNYYLDVDYDTFAAPLSAQLNVAHKVSSDCVSASSNDGSSST